MFDPIFSLLFLAAATLISLVIGKWIGLKRRVAYVGIFFAVLVGAEAAITVFLHSSNQNAEETFVLAPASKADHFTSDLGRIIQRYGFDPNPAQVTDDKGLTTYILEGKGHWLRLWSTNHVLSGQEDPEICGRYPEPHSDPGQYLLTVSSLWPLGTKEMAQQFLSQVNVDLKAIGYEVRTNPLLPCSPLSKLRAPH